MKFDFEGARKAGLSDSEIVQYLSTLPNNGNLNTLKEMGASDSHIVDLWSGSKNFSIIAPQESQKPQNNPSPIEQSKTEQPQIEQPKDAKSLFESIPDKPTIENTPQISQEQNQNEIQQPTQSTPEEDNLIKTGNSNFSNNPITPQVESTTPLATQTQQEPPKPEDSFSGTLVDILDDGLGISLSEQRAKKRQKRNEYLAEKIATSDAKSYNDLDDEEKNFIRNKYNEKNSILGIRNPFAILDKNEDKFQTIKKDLQKEHQIKQILESDLSYDDLTLEQKQLINDKTSIFKKFSKPQEVFEDLKSEYQIHKIAPTIEKSISELNNISTNKRLYNIFNSDSSLRDKYLQDVYNIATNAGFDNVSVDTARHKMYLLKDEKAYEVKDGFFDTLWDDIKSSKFELGASLAGAVAGSKFGPTPQIKLIGGIIGGAIGAIGGSGLDYQINSWLLKRKKDNDELLGKMLESGALSVVGDVATLGAIKLVKSSYNSLKKIPAYANELRENFTSQNINGAMKLLEDVGISKSQAESVAKKMDQYVETRFVADKEDSFLDKALSKVSKINDSVRQKEKIAFDVAYADPVLWKYIGAVAKNEPKFSNFIHNSITQRAKKISLDPEVKLGDIQEAIKDYEKNLSNEYGEAIDLLDTALPNYRFYPQEFLENKLSKIAEHIGENKSEGIIAGLNNQIKDMGEGLNVSQMIDIRKLINKTLRRNARFDYNDIGALKDINSYIDGNIEEALLKNAKSEPKLEVLYDEWKKINAKYSDYKELQESKLYKDIFSDNYNNDEKLGNAFINWSKTDERLTDSIIGRLDPRMQDKTQAFILAKSIDKHIQDTLNDGKVVDFLELKKTLSHLENKITNKSLKDHIDILKDMADLFYNDINLMRESGQINILTPNSGSGISHDLIARAHTSTISNIYRTIQRFLPTTAGKNSAFLYHLGKAMNMSRNSKELIFDLVSSPDTPPSLLKELRPAIEAYNGRVGNAIDNAQEIQTQKDQQNYLDMLESSEKYEKERIQNDTISDSQALERMETSGVSDVGSTGEQAIPHRGDTEGLLLDSGEIRATNGNRDGEFGRVSGNDEGGDRPLRSSTDGRRDERARTTRKIPQEPQEIRETNKSTTGTSRGRLEAKQTPESTIITQEGLPPSPSLNELAKSLKKTKDPLENITDFGTNYPEYYHDGKGAIEKLLQTKEGQVQGAFYKEELGDIDLVWGEVTNAEKHTGYGLAHIIDKHPEITPEKLENIITEGEATIRNNEAVKIEKDGYKVVLKGNWKGEPTNNKWVVTAYENKKEAPSISSDANHIEESLSKTSSDNLTQEQLKNQLDKFDNFIQERLPLEPMLSEEEANTLYNKILLDWLKEHPNMDTDFVMMYDFYLKNKMINKTPTGFTNKGKELSFLSLEEFNHYKDKILSKELPKHPLENITDFGTNYPEYYHDGKGAIQKLLQEKQGQVQGAFYRSDIGDITLVWGKEGTGKSDGFGLSKIVKFHPEVIDKLDELISTLPITKESPNRYQLENEKYKLAIRKEYEGDKENWVLTAFEKDGNSVSSRTDFRNAHTQATDKTTSVRAKSDSTTQEIKNQDPLENIKDFGTNYPEYYHDGKGAIEKLLQEKQGQVQGAFYKEGLGDIDLVWGDSKMGLAHILEKHPEVIEKIPEIIEKGEVDKGTNRVFLNTNDSRLAIALDYKGKDKKWIITAYDKDYPSSAYPHQEQLTPTTSAHRMRDNLNPNPTTEKLKNQELKAEKISEQLSEAFKEAYNKYEGTKSTEYQQTKEIEKSDLAVGITANVYTKVADEIMDRSSLELALHNNWVKETIKDPFGINFKKSTFSTIRGKEALETLLTYKLGQVKGAFTKEGLGDIDLVWGDSKMGLAHILEKHPEVIEKIPEIIEKGEVIKNGEFETIVLKNNELYKVGLSKGWNGNGENHWVLTAYEDTRLPHSDLLPSNGVTSRDVLPSNNLEVNPTTEQLKNQELIHTYEQLQKKYPENWVELAYSRYRFKDGNDPYQTLKDQYQKLIQTKKTPNGSKIPKNVIEEHKYFLNMLNNPEVEKFLKSTNDDVFEVVELKNRIKLDEQRLKFYRKTPGYESELKKLEESLQEHKKLYEAKMKEIYGKYPIEEESKEDLIKEAFSEFSSEGTLSETTKQKLEKSGSKVETEGENIIIDHPVERTDKDLEPLSVPSTPEAIITTNGYKQYDGLGNIIKEISITPDTLSSIEKQGNITTTETLDLTTNKSTKEVEVTNPEVLVPITSPSSSSAPSSSIIAKLKDDFKIDPNATLPKSPKKRFDNNIEAIRILKKLEQTKTLPTLEEKQKLSLYVGWGGLSNSFKDNSPEDKLLRELLNEEEYIRARNSTLSSYYTPYFVVDSMYKALQKMGFSGGEILEPSVGVGNFFGLLPDSLRHTSNLRGIELDDTTAKIAKYLYPSAKIEHTGYENALLPQNNYDLVIGNPPYGSFSVYDKNFKKESKHNIHNYFMLKNLALTKEDGILAQIITTNFLDTKNPEVRELIAKEAEFLGAIRLPQGSFDDTQVATDIVFFKKLKKGETASFKEWVNLKSIPDTQGKEDIPINSYFVNNPQYMLGTPGRYGGMYGADTVGFKANGNTQVQLQKAIEELTEGIHIDTRPILASSTIAQKTIDNLQAKPIDDLLHSSYIRPGGIALDSKSKEIYRLNQNEELEKVPDLELIDKTQEEFDKLTEVGKKAKLAQIKRIKEMIPAISEIRDTLMHLKRLQLDPMADESSIGTQRKKLNTLYDDFRNTFHTFLSDSKIAKAFDGDPTYPHISALEEDYKRVDKKYQAKKADIFTKRTQFPYVKPTKAKDIEDGIFISYNQTGRLDFDTIASLLDKDSESIKKEMLDKNLAFKDNEGNIIYAPEFLSGDIKAKIKSFEEKELDEYQNKAKNALLKVVPPKVEIEGIGINMGANYIPIEIYQDFAKEVLGGGENALSYQKLTDKFIVDFKSSIEADNTFGVTGEYKKISASDVFDSALNDRKITMGIKKGDIFYPDPNGQIALDQQIGAIKEAFKNFIYEDYKRAEKIENVYNDIFNNTKLREFDGSFLKLEGSNNLITLRPHQKNAIYRVISSPTTLLDHTVGTGKTYTMVGSAMELRRLGLAQKPLIVVPNHIVNQFGAEFARLYPDANILATRRFDKKSRQRTLSAITTGDWDAIIIGHSNFEMLPISQDAQLKFMMEQIATYEKAIKIEKIQRTGSSLSVKQLESALESKKRKLNELMDTKKDETIHFEDLGIDALFLDEAHEFKNLEFYSRQNISGLGSQKGSKKAFDLFMKTRYLQDKNKKIVFATGTPISNSIAELYTLQKYLDFEGLEKKGINSFDQWSKTFGKVESRFEYHPKGDFKLTNRFVGYINMPELIKEYKKFSDVIVNEDVEAMLKLQGKEFDLPKADFITATIKKSPRQEKFMQEIMERSEQIDNGIDPAKDNYLKVTTDGKKGSLDMRLIDPLYEDNPDSKVNTSIANIIKEYNKWKQDKGTQLVFLDMSTPKNKNPKAKKELDELLKRIEQGDEEAEEILRAKGGSDYIKVINNDGFSVYEDIKDKLIKEGIPEKEIAFIHDFDTDKKKAELFTKVNDGEVRILLGSTSKMGAGTNVQERIVAIHHLDAPWRPADIEQRNGRGIRQGNNLYEKYGKDKFKVNIYTYVTKGMLDTMIFEKLHTKAKFISQLRKGELSGREIEDIGDEVLNFAEIQAATLEDRRYLEILELKRDIDSLTALQKNIANINLRTTREINALEYEVKNKPKEIQAFKSDMEAFNKGGNKVQIGNNIYIKGEKNNGLSEALEGIRIDRDIQSIYKYNDFIIQASVSKRNYDFGYVDLIAHSPNTEESYLISTTKKQDFKPNGALTKIDNYFKAQRLLAMQNELKNAQIALPKLKNSLKKFDKQKELEEKTKRHIKLIEDLRVKLNSHPYVGLGLFGAISGGEIDYNQDGKNDEADMLLGALGAIIGGRAVKYLLTRNKDVIKNVLLHHFPDKKEDIDTAFKKEVQKEKRGIYNVAYNNKKATIIKEDLKSIDDFIRFSKGNHKGNKRGYGVNHIKARHSNPKDIGYITQQELLDVGNHMREYLKHHKEPFIEKNGARIYEWENKQGVRFRVVVDKRKGGATNLPQLPRPSTYNDIITFYSDRNFKQKMKFRNPNLNDKGVKIW